MNGIRVLIKAVPGTGALAQWLRVLATVPEDRSSVPSIHLGLLMNTSNSSSRQSDALFCFPRPIPAHVCSDTHTDDT